jgi:PEP-CTERM motif
MRGLQPPLLSFTSWRDLSLRSTQSDVRERPTRFFEPTRDYPTRTPASVPEPATIGLLLIGLASTLYFKRRAVPVR